MLFTAVTPSEENYLRAIYLLTKKDEYVSTGKIAESVKMTPASVTDMVKKLGHKGLLNYHRYQGVNLTENGTKVAKELAEKQEICSSFLINELKLIETEAELVAAELALFKDPSFTERLTRLQFSITQTDTTEINTSL